MSFLCLFLNCIKNHRWDLFIVDLRTQKLSYYVFLYDCQFIYFFPFLFDQINIYFMCIFIRCLKSSYILIVQISQTHISLKTYYYYYYHLMTHQDQGKL